MQQVNDFSLASRPLSTFILVLITKIQQLYAEPGLEFLPSVQELGQLFQVSRPSILRATAILKSKGELDFHRGKRMRISRHSGHGLDTTIKKPPRASLRLYLELSSSVKDGLLHWGEALPKRQKYAHDYGISVFSVSRVLKQLESKGLVHQFGKKFIVGPFLPSRHSSLKIPKAQSKLLEPRILIFTVDASANSWTYLCQTSRESPFGQMFVAQANRYGIQLEHISAHNLAANQPQTKLTESLMPLQAEMKAKIHLLGNALLGILIACKASSLTNLVEWIQFFLSMKQKVLWLDRADEGKKLQLDKLILRNPSYFGQLRYSEKAMVRSVIDFIHQFGHQRAFMPLWEKELWHKERFAELQKQGKTCNPPLLVDSLQAFTEKDWFELKSPDFINNIFHCYHLPYAGIKSRFDQFNNLFSEDIKNKFSPSIPTKLHPVLGFICYARLHILEQIPSALNKKSIDQDAHFLWDILRLCPVLTNKSITILIAPNDRHAKLYQSRLLELGLKIPQDLSLISFDNSLRYGFEQITSVDPGFAVLGEKAIQTFLTSTKSITKQHQKVKPLEVIKPLVIDRGSVERKKEVLVTEPLNSGTA